MCSTLPTELEAFILNTPKWFDCTLGMERLHASTLTVASLAVNSLSFKNHWTFGFGKPSTMDSNLIGWSLTATVSVGLFTNNGAP